MWPFGKRAKLVRLVDRLAFYNDKGIEYSRHASSTIERERGRYVSEIRKAIESIGVSSLPKEFGEAVESGTIDEDLSGQYVDVLKQYFR